MAADTASIHSLSLDVLLKVFRELPTTDRASLPFVCKTWAVYLKTSGELPALAWLFMPKESRTQN